MVAGCGAVRCEVQCHVRYFVDWLKSNEVPPVPLCSFCAAAVAVDTVLRLGCFRMLFLSSFLFPLHSPRLAYPGGCGWMY